MDDITREFLIESREGLDQLDIDLVELEKVPDDATVLGRVFRTIHSIKGTCGFLGFEKLERLAHVGETLLGRLRDHELALDAEMTSALLAMASEVADRELPAAPAAAAPPLVPVQKTTPLFDPAHPDANPGPRSNAEIGRHGRRHT